MSIAPELVTGRVYRRVRPAPWVRRRRRQTTLKLMVQNVQAIDDAVDQSVIIGIRSIHAGRAWPPPKLKVQDIEAIKKAVENAVTVGVTAEELRGGFAAAQGHKRGVVVGIKAIDYRGPERDPP